ncbi:SDR family oxidoreductase [Halorhabdus sp. CBA1104]|uniref:SDR family oxidoreductase n=1 Tax=unclassified Halorhabdus TaxID=2621901 RepID=UPI0012B3EB4E|nr:MULTISPECIES: SDR family oxidoreductase [unclassified Halorhabdus]QGN06611.1 SDR family oxidoreductase [Halorhabdus sp. CBA1104]
MGVEYDFRDRVVLVTGAGGALGSATAEAFLDAGATVAAADVIAPDDDAHMLASDSTRLSTHVVDFTDERAVESAIETVVETHGRLDALVAVAGTWRGGDPVEGTDIGTFELLFDVNVRTAFLATKHALPHLQDSEGSIVTVASRSSLEGGKGDALYRASKAAVRLLTESIAAENEGVVRANAIMPGVIDTPANRESMPDADFEAWTDPSEIAEVIQFLASDAATPTTGGAIPVSGDS